MKSFKKKKVENLIQSQKGAFEKFLTSNSKAEIKKNSSDSKLIRPLLVILPKAPKELEPALAIY